MKAMNPVYKARWITLCCLAILTKASATIPPNGQDVRMTKTVEEVFLLNEDGQVDIINKYGQVVVNTWAKDSVAVKVEIVGYGKNMETANKILSRVNFDFKKNGAYVNLETVLDRNKGFIKEMWNNIGDYSKSILSKNKLEVNYDVKIPEGAQLHLDNKFGDVYLDEMYGKANISVSHGNLRSNNFTQPSKIDVSFGDVRIKKFTSGPMFFKAASVTILEAGTVDISSSSSEIALKRGNEVRFDSKSDKVLRIGEINRVRGKFNFSKISLARLNKSLDMQSGYGEIYLEEIAFSFSNINIVGKSTDISLNFEGNSYLDVDITAREEKLSLPRIEHNLSKQYVDDKAKFVKMLGFIGDKNNYPGKVSINAQSGLVDINLLTVKSQSATK